jgi:signal transduction histidine kinase
MLLVIVGVLGLRVLGDSNSRVEQLGQLHERVKAYRELQTDAGQLRLLLGMRAGGSDVNVYNGAGSATLTQSGLTTFDEAMQATLSRVGQASDIVGLGFVPPADELTTLRQVRAKVDQMSGVLTSLIALDRSGSADAALKVENLQAEPLANELVVRTTILVDNVQSKADQLTAQNRSSFAASQDLFIAVAAGSIFLALLFGYVLSWSLVAPIRQMGSRLSAIAAGDFSGRVDIPNRDELGALAENINRMSEELGRVYAELETVSHHKSEFLANMSHELRTPLNAIIGFSQVLREQMFGELNAKQREYLDDILTSGQHLLNLINDILDLAKVEAGRMELHPGVFSLQDSLESAVVLVRERAVRQGVTLAVEIDESIGLIEADERKFKQILFNLLSNAVKFTSRGGKVTLAAEVTGDQAEISVADTGIGISAADQERIFEDFFQVGAGNNQEGTGLGLALTKKLVELHGGLLRVKSAPGAGTTFSFTIPLGKVAHVELAAAPAGLEVPS